MNAPRRSASLVSLPALTVLIAIVPFVAAASGAMARAPLRTAVKSAPHPTDQWRAELLTLVNRTRHTHHLPMLLLNQGMSREALRHSRQMAERRQIFHTSNLSSIVTHYGGTEWGEDVARGLTLHAIRDAWLREPGSRNVLLNPRFRRVAIGVAKRDRFYWATVQIYT